MTARHPTVTLVGRQNVGKSTLFNTLLGQRRAIVSPVAGTTRDQNRALVSWRGQTWQLVDTGGFTAISEMTLEKSIRHQAESASGLAEVICLIVDGQNGLTLEDRDLMKRLRRYPQPILLVINKLDSPRLRAHLPPELLSLGFGDPVLVSARNGTGTGDLLDRIDSLLGPIKSTKDEPAIALVLLGKPNVGKSSLINRLIGEERIITSEEPRTTRDAIEIPLHFRGQSFRLIDTAGLVHRQYTSSRSARANEQKVEQESMERSLRTLTWVEVAAIILDATQEVTKQDRVIINAALEAKVGLFLVINKWDCITEKTPDTLRRFEQRLRRQLAFLSWTPMTFVSAKTGQRVRSLLEITHQIAEARKRWITKEELQGLLHRLDRLERGSRRRSSGRFELEQVDIAPPTFRLTTSRKQQPSKAKEDVLIRELRHRFDFSGTPLKLIHERRLRS